jgi:hypothetical protein
MSLILLAQTSTVPGCRVAHRDLVRLHASAGGGGGSGGGGSSGGGGGGGGGGDDDAKPKKSGIVWKGWADRVAADPQFVYKVIVEQVIGVGASVIGDMAGRPNWGLNELDFVFATLIVGSIVNFALMYLLAPTGAAAGGAASAGFAAKLFSEQTLLNWGAPGGHMFQPGFPLAKRLVNFAYKGVLFSGIGMCAGLVGTATSNGLLLLRKKLDPAFITQNEAPSVLGNASTWALHMGFSSNLRYQMLNGMEMVVQPLLPSGLFRVMTSVVRGVNNAAGGVSFVFLAKLLGVQKSNDPVPVVETKGENKKKK